jgi:two-component system osmolarity sensor histidine kinase EnvZ
MFYGLSKFIKDLLPKRLFYRALLIVAVPVIVIQLIITIVFFDSLWIKTNQGMTRALVNEVKTLLKFITTITTIRMRSLIFFPFIKI